jgi:DNA-binding NtrC family response regulator
MEHFIAVSPVSQKIYKIAQMSSSLPVNVLITGQTGVGRKLLANVALKDAQSFEANELEKLIIDQKINLNEYTSLIIYNINKVLNKNEFLEKLKNIKLVATGFYEKQDYTEKFAVKINITPLDKRPEDLKELTDMYIKEANKIYFLSNTPKKINIDLSGNGITLKQSIYKSILLQSINKADISNILFDYFTKEMKDEKTYKDLLPIFEIPLLKASKAIFKSQLKMSEKLKINRITLRKKLSKYFGE